MIEINPVHVATSNMSLSGLMAPPIGTPKGLVLALHGGAYTAPYWTMPADPEASLLMLAARRGFLGVALDRPGYGLAANEPRNVVDQVEIIYNSILEIQTRYGCLGPVLVVGHSLGGILGLFMGAHHRAPMVTALDVCGVPLVFSEAKRAAMRDQLALGGMHLPPTSPAYRRELFFGPDGTFSAEALAYDKRIFAPISMVEFADAAAAPDMLPAVMSKIRIPVRYTVAEFEKSSVANAAVTARANQLLAGSRRADVRQEPNTGHNISLHQAARDFHIGILDAFEALPAGT